MTQPAQRDHGDPAPTPLDEILVSRPVERALLEIAVSLQVADSSYEAANRAYRSVGEWLQRPASTLQHLEPEVTLQGSFRHGTTTSPINQEDDHDVDLVCCVNLGKSHCSQEELKRRLGVELDAYAKAHSMSGPEEGNRCWTLIYADGARFHLDCLPAIPDANAARALRAARGLSADDANTTIAITDRRHPFFSTPNSDWLQSNPEGYATWFHARMVRVYEARREALALESRAAVEDIPRYRIRTPLQMAVQILKRHRDVFFGEDGEHKPISIILTTLAAHAYDEQTTLPAALLAIVEHMTDYIEYRDGIDIILNPSQPTENFADRWALEPARQDAFYQWHDAITADLRRLLVLERRGDIDSLVRELFGRSVSQRIDENRRDHNQTGDLRGWARRFNPRHRQRPTWPLAEAGEVQIAKITVARDKFRHRTYRSGGSPIPKKSRLSFEATTTVPLPYDVYWQVVNMGREAADRSQLRGGFDGNGSGRGGLRRSESAKFTGTHTIECFIVKDGLLAARSGRTDVNIR